MQRIDKTPTYCPDNDSLKVGDILVFNYNANRELRKGQMNTIFFQRWLNERGGHKDTVHVAIVVRVNGAKKIAHLRADGFKLDDLDTIKTTTHVYRPNIHRKKLITEINLIISEIQADAEMRKQLNWNTLVSIHAFLRTLTNSLETKTTEPNTTTVQDTDALPDTAIAMDSICSKFVAELYISACHRLTKKDNSHHNYRRDLANIGQFPTPKSIQAYLYRNSNFDYFVLPSERNNLYTQLRKIVRDEIIRLRSSSNAKTQKKGNDLQFVVDDFEIDGLSKDVFAESLLLLKAIIPILRRNTGAQVKQPTSYVNVMNFAKSQGLYSAYIDHDLVFAKSTLAMAELAKKTYHCSQPMAEMYAAYRELGYSDEEAKFEATLNPDFRDWFMLNPIRNTVAAATVFPFLFYSLPYGLYRTAVTKNRNQHQVDDNDLHSSRNSELRQLLPK